jgi:hypothetical protein
MNAPRYCSATLGPVSYLRGFRSAGYKVLWLLFLAPRRAVCCFAEKATRSGSDLQERKQRSKLRTTNARTRFEVARTTRRRRALFSERR